MGNSVGERRRDEMGRSVRAGSGRLPYGAGTIGGLPAAGCLLSRECTRGPHREGTCYNHARDEWFGETSRGVERYPRGEVAS